MSTTIQIQLDDSITQPLAPRLARLNSEANLGPNGIAQLLIEQFALHATPAVEEWLLARSRGARELPSLWETVEQAARTAQKFELLPELKLAEAVAAIARHSRYK